MATNAANAAESEPILLGVAARDRKVRWTEKSLAYTVADMPHPCGVFATSLGSEQGEFAIVLAPTGL
jgi:hypothetical protein